MTATKAIISNSVNKTKIKFTATAAADTITINLKKTITLASTGNLTFVAGDDGTGKIVRASGSWATDFASAPGNRFVTVASSVNNNRTFSVLSITTTSVANDTIVVLEKVVTEGPVGATATSYESDVAAPGQTVTTPVVDIAGTMWSFGTGSCNITRNAVSILNLFGVWWAKEDLSNYSIKQNNTYDIVLTTATAGGTVIIELNKVGGFAPVYQLRDVERP